MSNIPPARIPDLDQLEPFNPEAICPKCGHRYVTALYRTYTKAFTQVKLEWIRRQCQRCSFLWDENCLGEDNWEDSDDGR